MPTAGCSLTDKECSKGIHERTDRLTGWHFPASDIPKQARKLYPRKLLGLIPDVSYLPAPLERWRITARPANQPAAGTSLSAS